MSEGQQMHPPEPSAGPHRDKEHFQARLKYFIIPSGPSFLGHGLHWALRPKTEFFSGRCRQRCLDFLFLCQNGSGLEMIKGD